MLHALGALMPGPAGPAPGGHPVLQPPPAPNGAALAPAAGDALAAAIALINNPAQLLVRFPFQGDTDMEDATYWTGVAMNSTAATMEYTLRWGCVCPWTATDADIKGDWGLSARQFICAVGYHDAQDLGLNDDGLPTNKVVWHTTRERVAGFCTTGKIYKWLAAPPPLVAKQAPRPAWLAGKPPGPQEDTAPRNLDELSVVELRATCRDLLEGRARASVLREGMALNASQRAESRFHSSAAAEVVGETR
jgi:hypothetical protein